MQTSEQQKGEAHADTPPGYRPVYAWYVVCLLSLLTLFSWMDRQIIVLLIDPIRNDLQISEVQVSLLTGFAFALIYAFAGIPFGFAVDRKSRRTIIAIGVFVWSLATVSCGLARNFVQLFIGRVGVGVGEAALSPAVSSILADMIPKRRLSLANCIVGVGAALGGGLSFMVGGAIAGMVSHGEVVNLPLFGDVRAWQVAFIAVGLPGIFLTFLVFTIREPVRTGKAKPIVSAAGEISQSRFWTFFRQNWQFYILLMTGFSFLAMGNYAMLAWGPTYMIRVFGWSPAAVGTSFGAAMASSMIVSLFLTGAFVDFFYARGMRDAHLRLLAWIGIVCLPIAVGSIVLHDAVIFLVGAFIFKFAIGGQGPIAVTAIQIVTPNEYRGRLVAIFFIAVGLGGPGLGPVLVALVTQYGFADDKMVGWSMVVTFLVIYPLGSTLLWLGTKYQRRMAN